MVELMPVPANLDRQTLLNLFLRARPSDQPPWATESQFHTCVVHWYWVLSVQALRLCFLQRPVEFGALDARPVGILFSMICPTVRFHLQLLSRLAFALHDSEFRGAVLQQASKNEILRQARRVDASLCRQDEGTREGNR